MKTIFVTLVNLSRNGTRSLPVKSLLLARLLLLPVLTALPLRASIPEPDNLFYGGITLDTVPVTAARSDVVIEARRTSDGPALASYRMGSDPALGNFYFLRLPLESVAPAANPDATQVGDSVFITVLDGGGLRAQTGFVVSERGTVQRIDFGVVATDIDGNGLPDAWELYHFSGLAEGAGALEFRFHGDDVERRTAVHQSLAGAEDLLMPRRIEGALAEDLLRPVEMPVVEQESTEHRAFGLVGMGQRVGHRIGGHGKVEPVLNPDFVRRRMLSQRQPGLFMNSRSETAKLRQNRAAQRLASAVVHDSTSRTRGVSMPGSAGDSSLQP